MHKNSLPRSSKHDRSMPVRARRVQTAAALAAPALIFIRPMAYQLRKPVAQQMRESVKETVFNMTSGEVYDWGVLTAPCPTQLAFPSMYPFHWPRTKKAIFLIRMIRSIHPSRKAPQRRSLLMGSHGIISEFYLLLFGYSLTPFKTNSGQVRTIDTEIDRRML
jgi:hypothetical protein